MSKKFEERSKDSAKKSSNRGAKYGIMGTLIVIGGITWSLMSCANIFDMTTEKIDASSTEIEASLDDLASVRLSGYRDSTQERMYIYVNDEKVGLIYTTGIFNQVMHIQAGSDKKEVATIGSSKEEMRADSGACYAINDSNGQIRHYLQDEIVDDGALPRDWYYVFYNDKKERVAYFADDGTTYGPFTIYAMDGTELAKVTYNLSFQSDVQYEITFTKASDEINIIDALSVIYLKNSSIVSD